MKKLFVIIFSLFMCNVSAQLTYYWSSTGSDANNGLSSSAPKQTLSHMQGYIDTCVSGTTIRIEAGSVYDESQLTIDSKTIHFRSFGTGSMPVLSGMKTLSMSSLGGNLYRCIDPDLPTRSGDQRIVGYVTVNGNKGKISCYPDSGYYRMIDAGSTTSLTDNSESWTNNEFTGAYAILRELKSYDWEITPGVITSNTGTVLTISGGFEEGRSADVTSVEKIFAIANSKRLDENYEFYHWNDTLIVYSTTTPTVRASVVDTIIIMTGATCTFDSIVIMGANRILIENKENSHLTLTGCRLIGSGNYLVRSVRDAGYTYQGGETTAYAGEYAYAGGGFNQWWSIASRFDSNYFHHIGVELVDNKDFASFESSHCILWREAAGVNMAQNNIFEKVRTATQQHNSWPTDNEIYFRENLINQYGIVTGDRGAVYTNSDTYSSRPRDYSRNFILNGRPQDTILGQGNTPLSYPHAIYWDQNSDGMTADSNTIETGDVAYKINNSESCNFRANKIVNMNVNITDPIWSGSITIDSIVFSGDIDGNVITNNEIVLSGNRNAIHVHRYVAYRYPASTTVDYNTYVKQSGVYDIFHFFGNFTANGSVYRTLDEIQTEGIYEQSSDSLTFPVDSARVFKNFSTSSHQFDIGSAHYRLANGSTATGTITVPAMYSTIGYLINADETGRDDLLYIDANLVPFYSPIESGFTGSYLKLPATLRAKPSGIKIKPYK